MTLSICTITEENLDAADRVTMAAYHLRDSNKARLRRNLSLQPDGWLLALQDDVAVGMVGTVDYGPFAYVGMMGVIPAAQRQGVGRALLEHLLRWLDERGCPTALLDASPDGTALYAHYAFVAEDETLHWQHDLTPLPAPLFSPAAAQISLFQLEALSELVAFDAQYFGTDRATVFASLYLDDPQRVFVTRNAAGNISGYVFVQKRTIGPWLAQNSADAEVLLMRALALPFAGKPMVLVSATNASATRLLEHYGFHRVRALLHMRRGQPAFLRRRDCLYAQASFALG